MGQNDYVAVEYGTKKEVEELIVKALSYGGCFVDPDMQPQMERNFRERLMAAAILLRTAWYKASGPKEKLLFTGMKGNRKVRIFGHGCDGDFKITRTEES